MSVAKEDKGSIIKEFAKNANDTGSSEVQVAILTSRIHYLTEHLKIHKKDSHSRRGLLSMVSKRKKLLKYIHSRDHNMYADLIGKLNIRGLKGAR